jgi:dienelactone hydrolase
VLAEGLASAGFIVVATNHPQDSLIAAYPDGREVRSEPYWPLDADRRTQGVAIGKFAEEVLLNDVRFVLERLQDLNARDDFWHGHLDLSRVGIVGHSMGGTTAAVAAKEEKRIMACAILDGSTYPGMNADVRPIELHKPLLFMVTEAHAANPETRGREYYGRQSDTYYVVISGDDHMSFSDIRLLQSRFSRESQADSVSYELVLINVELTTSMVQQFFAKYLNHTIAPELDALTRIDKK